MISTLTCTIQLNVTDNLCMQLLKSSKLLTEFLLNPCIVTSTPNVSSESVEGLGGESPDRDWLVNAFF